MVWFTFSRGLWWYRSIRSHEDLRPEYGVGHFLVRMVECRTRGYDKGDCQVGWGQDKGTTL